MLTLLNTPLRFLLAATCVVAFALSDHRSNAQEIAQTVSLIQQARPETPILMDADNEDGEEAPSAAVAAAANDMTTSATDGDANANATADVPQEEQQGQEKEQQEQEQNTTNTTEQEQNTTNTTEQEQNTTKTTTGCGSEATNDAAKNRHKCIASMTKMMYMGLQYDPIKKIFVNDCLNRVGYTYAQCHAFHAYLLDHDTPGAREELCEMIATCPWIDENTQFYNGPCCQNTDGVCAAGGLPMCCRRNAAPTHDTMQYHDGASCVDCPNGLLRRRYGNTCASANAGRVQNVDPEAQMTKQMHNESSDYEHGVCNIPNTASGHADDICENCTKQNEEANAPRVACVVK